MIHLGAERVIAAERDGERIAVEIKSFVKSSLVQDLKEATGQFVLYAGALADDPNNADRTLFLAIRDETYETLFEQPVGLLAYDLEAEGAPKEDIVPAFYSVEVRSHMGYAVT